MTPHSCIHLPQRLTPREQELVMLLLEAKRDKEIAAAMGITPRTVRYHISSVFRVLKVSSRAQVVLMLFRARPGADR